MKKSRKPTLVEERHFPFECSISYGVSNDYTALHWHKELEICYIRQGTGNYLINGTEYPFSGGDIFLIGNDEIHLCHDDRDLIMQVFMFAPEFLNSGYANPFDYEFLRPFYERTEHFCNKIEKDTAVSGRLTDLLSEMEKEYTTRQNAYDLMIKSLLLEFMALIVRHYFTGNKTDPKENLSGSATEKVRDIITYLDAHYGEPVSLGTLAEHFSLSVPYLCSTFKTFTGSSPINFLINRRILAAKELLTSSEKSILDISEECGFGSLSNFNHLFKSLTGRSPRDYRRSC